MITTYMNFLNETRMDVERPFLLFSETVRVGVERGDAKYQLFYPFYGDNTIWYALGEEVGAGTLRTMVRNHQGTRFTLLKSTTYKDNSLEEEDRRFLSVAETEDIIAHRDEYRFFELLVGPRIEGEIPRRENAEVVRGVDNEDWYFVIRKDINCLLVKTISRQEGGMWAEYQMEDKYGWQRRNTSIVVKRFKVNNVAIDNVNNFLRTILDRDDVAMFRVDEADERNIYAKYDLIIDDEFKIEIKKYSEKQLVPDAGGFIKPIRLAEQFKISDRTTLKKLVRWYNESHNNVAQDLLNLPERELSTRFKIDTPLTRDIKHYNNSKIGEMEAVLNRMDEEKWMEGVYGIYFVPERGDRKYDFLIKIDEENVRNIDCVWDTITREWGLDRLILNMRINPDAMEYILTPNNIFVAAYRLRDYLDYQESRRLGVMRVMNGDTYVFNNGTNRWERRP